MNTGVADGVTFAMSNGEHGPLLEGLFARAEVACHCRFWHFGGTNNDWLARVALEPETNRAEMRAALDNGSPEMQGVVALHGDRAIGWMKLSPSSSVEKLYAQRPYRRLPCFQGDRERVLAVGCFLVDPAWRGNGLSRRLLAFGVAFARETGARAIEAFPRRAEGLRDEERFAGAFAAFASEGFAVVHDFAPYPVLRLDLG